MDDYFPRDYFQARTRFLDFTERLGWNSQSIPLAARGPADEELTIDVASSGEASDGPLLLLTSGLHGVEGFVGSAIQAALLDQWGRSPPGQSVRIVMVHALNPYGYAHCRRFNEDNVDPNRNFLLDGETYEGCPDNYRLLDPILNPPRPPSRLDFFVLRAARTCLRHGFRALADAVVAGQYEFPKGLFYGGSGPSESFAIVREEMPKWIGGACPVVHLDYHSGLGRRGELKLLIDDPPPSETMKWLLESYHREQMSVYEQGESLYRARGSISMWCSETFRANELTFMCAEIGTYPALKVLSGLRAENQACHWSQDEGTRRNQQLRLKELFCPAAPKWRQQSLEDGCRVANQALQALGKLSGGG